MPDTPLSARPLDMATLIALSDLAEAAQRGTRVARLLDDGEIAVGIARSIGDTQGCMSPNGTDVRDQYLRVTLLSGFEACWPLADLVPLVRTGEFSCNYQR